VIVLGGGGPRVIGGGRGCPAMLLLPPVGSELRLDAGPSLPASAWRHALAQGLPASRRGDGGPCGAGPPIKAVKEPLGHSDVKITCPSTPTCWRTRPPLRPRCSALSQLMTSRLAKVWQTAPPKQARGGTVGTGTAPYLDFRQSGWGDSNSRPLDPQSSALPNCATARRGTSAYPAHVSGSTPQINQPIIWMTRQTR
jgi:hypothetical protein